MVAGVVSSVPSRIRCLSSGTLKCVTLSAAHSNSVFHCFWNYDNKDNECLHPGTNMKIPYFSLQGNTTFKEKSVTSFVQRWFLSPTAPCNPTWMYRTQSSRSGVKLLRSKMNHVEDNLVSFVTVNILSLSFGLWISQNHKLTDVTEGLRNLWRAFLLSRFFFCLCSFWSRNRWKYQ